jgi:hypothetical protein
VVEEAIRQVLGIGGRQGGTAEAEQGFETGTQADERGLASDARGSCAIY